MCICGKIVDLQFFADLWTIHAGLKKYFQKISKFVRLFANSVISFAFSVQAAASVVEPCTSLPQWCCRNVYTPMTASVGARSSSPSSVRARTPTPPIVRAPGSAIKPAHHCQASVRPANYVCLCTCPCCCSAIHRAVQIINSVSVTTSDTAIHIALVQSSTNGLQTA